MIQPVSFLLHMITTILTLALSDGRQLHRSSARLSLFGSWRASMAQLLPPTYRICQLPKTALHAFASNA